MKVIKLVSASFENFKKLNWTVEFGEKKTQIFAMNRTGKSSMADGIFWVLFGKSSTGKSEGKEFRPRPYDSQGVDIDHVYVVLVVHLALSVLSFSFAGATLFSFLNILVKKICCYFFLWYMKKVRSFLYFR